MIRNQRTLNALAIIFVVLFSINNLFAVSGDVDTSFNAALVNNPAERAIVTVIQPDGKILIHGNFQSLNGLAVPNLVRLNIDGTIDTSFNAPGISPTLTNSGLGIKSIALQSDGKIVIGGSFGSIDDETAWSFARLNADGSRDASFAFNSVTTNLRNVSEIAVLPDDRILLLDGSQGLFRVQADGSNDSSFQITSNCSSAGDDLAVQADGKIFRASGTEVLRCNSDGTDDNTFTSPNLDGIIFDIAVQTDGKLLIGGGYSLVNGFLLSKVSRYNTDGSVDTSFVSNFNTAGFITTVVSLPDGTIFVGGVSLNNTSSSQNNGVYKLNSDGSLDSSFSSTDGNSGQVWDVDVQADGKVIRSSISSPSNINAKIVHRMNPDGTQDNTFLASFGKGANGLEVFVRPDGKIYAGGNFSFANNVVRNGIARFNADGSVDMSFNANFDTFLGMASVQGIATQSDGKVIVGMDDFGSSSLRLNSDGSLDVVFPSTSGAKDVKVLSDGKILIAGNGIKRFNSDGSRDTSFNVSVGQVYKCFVQSDGKILMVGGFTEVNSVNRGRIARLNPDGTLDTTFNPPGGANGHVFDIAPQSDGKVIVVGQFTGINFTNRAYIARLNTDGSLDTSFTPDLNSPVHSVLVQSNNKVLIGGDFDSINGFEHQKLARLNANGTIDSSFKQITDISVNESNEGARVSSMVLQDDDKIIIGGSFTKVSGVSNLGLARLFNTIQSAVTDYDFDGDGKADIAVFRPSENKWYVLRSSDFGVTQQVFAIAGDSPTAADYDGDGQADFSIFRNSLGDWWSLASSSGSQVFTHLGQNGDIPRPSDFDGDGRADYIVYRPTDFTWYRVSSGNGQASHKVFGAAGDKPLVGDFDGDGKSDVAIYRPSTGNWWWQSSVDNIQRATRWGISIDIPSPGDYDGDGITDFAVYRPSTGVWYILNSSTQQATIIPFGLSEDKPVPADYDGDGKTDIAVFRPSTGIWYLLQSTEGFSALQFGISSDIPIPNALIP